MQIVEPMPIDPNGDTSLRARLAAIDRLPLSYEGRTLARLAAHVNEVVAIDGRLPVWLSQDECERIGEGIVSACHAARLPVGRVRRLVDPGAAAWERGATDVMRPRD